ncbi:MAG: serine/threonine protein kinase [Deltaproteobacteria bacterium]|nr:serine/threonine protein kinase [Deltaproteobacteria bacterium]
MEAPQNGKPPPVQIERYRIIEEVGRGGMAVVFRGHDGKLDREVAVKILHAHLASEPESQARFQREARAVARLRHPNIIEIYDFADKSEGPSYIVTEFIHGPTLKAFMDEHEAFFPEIAVLVTIQICEAIGHAHSLQIIHRDLKPENMMIDRDGLLKLMDFGIAKVIDQQQQMTLTGTILGSPAHMAPELLEGRELDYRSDVFSIGTILYWLACGVLPFTGANPHQVLKRILQGEYPDPQQTNPLVGAGLARIIRKALALSPEDRYESAESMKLALLEELAYLDLEDVRQELRRCFADPGAYIEKLKPRLVAALLERARLLVAAKKHRLGLEALDRLLNLEPDHPEGTDLLYRLQRRRRWRRLALVLALGLLGTCLLGGAALGAYHLVRPVPVPAADGGLLVLPAAPDAGRSERDAGRAGRGDPAPRSAARDAGVPSVAGDPAGTADGSSGDARRGGDRRRGPRRGGDRTRIASLPEPPAVSQPVTIQVDPYFDRLEIDGQLVAVRDRGNYYGQRFKGELNAGVHRVKVLNTACQEDEFELRVPEKAEGPIEHRRKLAFRPASLVIISELPQASVWVNGIFKGTAGTTRDKPITIPIEGSTGRLEVKLRLTHPANGEHLARFPVLAGRTKVYRVARSAFAIRAPDGGGP